MSEHGREVLLGERFEFGRNWRAFLEVLDEERIDSAKLSLTTMLGAESLDGKTFLDVGSGSGLVSLVARKLGGKVYSFDYDPESVACTSELKRRYFPGDKEWVIEEGSALDEKYLSRLGQFDIVYSWGVLHHTGAMWQALENITRLVNKEGVLFIAIYNDQQYLSKLWLQVKKIYISGALGRGIMKAIYYPWFFFRTIMTGIVRHGNPFAHFLHYQSKRGMSLVHDWDDWLGGYPFEVAKPEDLLKFYRTKGFELIGMTTTNQLGCNQLVFRKKV